MKKPKGGFATRIYRVLLKTYPSAFRAKHEGEMEEVFLHLLEREGRQRGLAGRVDAWLSGGWDAISEGIRMRLRKEAWHGHTPPSPIPSKGVGEMFGALLRDVRLTVRGLLRKPLFALTVILKDIAAHDAYQEDPLHQTFIADNKELWKRVKIYDAD